MDEHLAKTPENMQFRGDTANNWKLWKQKFKLFLLASGKSTKSDEVKVAILLNFLGDEGLHIYNTFEYDEGESDIKLDTVLKKFDAYCEPIKNVVYEHFKFFKRDQLPDESVDNFITGLKQLSSTCEFGTLKDVLIRDRLVIGIRDTRIQEKLLQSSNLSLSEAIQTCRSMESSVATQKQICKEYSRESVSVAAINRKMCNMRPYSSKCGESPSMPPGSKGNYCSRCGLKHEFGKCLALNRYCSRCGQKGHYRKFCNTRLVHEMNKFDDETTEDLSSSDYECDTDSHIVWTVTLAQAICSVNVIEWFETVEIAGVKTRLKIDTGSQVNILNYKDFSKLKLTKNILMSTKSTLLSYSGHKLEVIGKIILECVYNGICKNLPFYILESMLSCSILGLQSSSELHIVNFKDNNYEKNVMMVNSIPEKQLNLSLSEMLDKYKNVFVGFGKLKKLVKLQ